MPLVLSPSLLLALLEEIGKPPLEGSHDSQAYKCRHSEVVHRHGVCTIENIARHPFYHIVIETQCVPQIPVEGPHRATHRHLLPRMQLGLHAVHQADHGIDEERQLRPRHGQGREGADESQAHAMRAGHAAVAGLDFACVVSGCCGPRLVDDLFEDLAEDAIGDGADPERQHEAVAVVREKDEESEGHHRRCGLADLGDGGVHHRWLCVGVGCFRGRT
mmetsp:Transcript_19543/g.54302  ORF Transcript_19543/g.54302 Transcript_19543/m.54302 type:complete len:218 (-) Transcript_19543:370-1023(-)